MVRRIIGWSVTWGVPVGILSLKMELPFWLKFPVAAWLWFLWIFFAFYYLIRVCEAAALPWPSDFNPQPGGPGVRTLPFHPELQERMERHRPWDWLSWWAGIFLRGSIYVGGLLILPLTLVKTVPQRFELLILPVCACLGGLAALWIPTALFWLLGKLWSRAEPPRLPPRLEATRPQSAMAQMVSILPLLLSCWLFTLGAYFSTPDPLLGMQRASFGVAALAIFGYPLYVRCQYWARRWFG